MDWRSVPSLTALRAFEAAARLGSFSAAARELNVTHAAVAQNVRALETHFGMSLMQRDGKGMDVTTQAQPLAETLTDALSMIASTCRDLIDQGEMRPLRIAVTPSFGANWLMPRLGSFWALHPETELEILPSMSLVNLRKDEIDIAIRYGKGGWPGVEAVPFVSAPLIVAASPAYLEGRRIDDFSDLSGLTWLLDKNLAEERRWVAEKGIALEQEKLMEFATSHLTKEAALAGLGITIHPEPLLASDVASGRLKVLFRQDRSDESYHVLTRPEVISGSRDRFVRWLLAEAKAATSSDA